MWTKVIKKEIVPVAVGRATYGIPGPEIIIPVDSISSLTELEADELKQLLVELACLARSYDVMNSYSTLNELLQHHSLSIEDLESELAHCETVLTYKDILSEEEKTKIVEYTGVLKHKIDELEQKLSEKPKKEAIKETKKRDSGFIYLIESAHGFKIGRTKNLQDRKKIFGVQLPFRWKFRYVFRVDNYHEIEKLLHSKFERNRLEGEWFTMNQAEIDDFCHLLRREYRGTEMEIL